MENTFIYEMFYDEENRKVTADISLEFYNDLVRWANQENTTPELFLQKLFLLGLHKHMKKSDNT